MQPLYTFDIDGGYTARVYADYSSDAPWLSDCFHGEVERHDGGPVPRGWTIIHDGWIYNTGAAIVRARREGWQCEAGRALGLKRGAMAYAAVKADREYLARWLRDDWCYVGVSVQREGVNDDFGAAVWGIESDAEDYIREVAAGLVCELT